MQPYTTEVHRALVYPLLLLTGNVPLAAMLATTTQLATVGWELLVAASPPTVSRMLAPPTGTKWQHPLSDQEAAASRPEEKVASLDISQEEHPPQKQKERRPFANLLK